MANKQLKWQQKQLKMAVAVSSFPYYRNHPYPA